MDLKKLSGAELELMELLWQNPEGLESSLLYAKYKGNAYSTISTRLGRIEKKGFLARKRNGRHHILIPLIPRDEYYTRTNEENFEKTYNKLKRIGACFGNQKITEEQYEKLKKVLDEMKND